ncbi:hypothetical protein B0H19DRAFT_1167544 [Mycena capillaripes]|nr:hypothetical protein B0H19DRAFT_1167544 [Mycena capillaripes]
MQGVVKSTGRKLIKRLRVVWDDIEVIKAPKDAFQSFRALQASKVTSNLQHLKLSLAVVSIARRRWRLASKHQKVSSPS